MKERIIDAIKELKSGQKLYQQRARIALPILVRQAMASKKIYYGDLAEEIEMPNARNLNLVLGCIGDAISELNELKPEEERIPFVNSVVVNKETGLPGDSVHIIRQELDSRQKLIIVNNELADVFSYAKWTSLLDEFGLQMPDPIGLNQSEVATSHRSSGESEEHSQLKIYVAQHPEIVGLKKSLGPGETEVELPSRDIPDVLFQNSGCRIAVEVKSHKSNEGDFKRGLFQCVKYLAILKACRSIEIGNYEVDSLLAIERQLTNDLIKIKNTLGVKVFENIQIQ